MEDRKTVLIVDDDIVYGKTLSKILSNSYNVILRKNGLEATEVLDEKGAGVSLIFLDLKMPVMDGYAFLDWICDNGQFIDIPIIVTTGDNDFESEVKCLDRGASEFVTKPFNPDIVIKRAESLIRLHEMAVLLNNIKYDPVTGAYNKTVFYDQISKLLLKYPDKEFDVACLDIEGFRLLVERYGEKRCATLLSNVYKLITNRLDSDYIIGKISESQFAFIGPGMPFEVYIQEIINSLRLARTSSIQGVIVNCGVYQNVDRSLSPEAMCHNAIMAAESINNRYGVYAAKYDESLRERALNEQFIVDNMKQALDEHHFKVYYQPKFRITDQVVSGAEALVRWIHPEKGFMNPGEFISVFEHNGFIQELDRYMLDTVCSDISKWVAAGNEAVPVSVNVSQTNFDKVDLAEEFEEIVDGYGIDHRLIHFEITESVNSADFNKKKKIISKFRQKGFLVELDDFGSGYSSLTTLCDLPIDVVKLDMGLIQKMFEKKHSAVISGALFTARELALKVVAEGVETAEQVQELKWRSENIPEVSIQGYYFSRPLPKEDFEKFLLSQAEAALAGSKEEPVGKKSQKTALEERSNNAEFREKQQLIKYKALMEIMGNVIYEYNHLTDEMTMEIFEEDGSSRKRTTGNYFDSVRTNHWIHISYVDSFLETIRMVYTYGRSKDVMASALMPNGDYRLCKYHFAPVKNDSGNVIRVVGRGEIVDYARETDIFRNINTGSFRYSVDHKQEFDYISETLLDLLGFESEEAFREQYDNSFISFVYEEDRERVLAEIDDQIRDDNVDYCEYRVMKADGSLIWLYDRGTLVVDEYGKRWFYVTVADLDDYKAKQLRRQREQDRLVNKFKSDTKHDKMTRLDNLEYSLHLIQKYLDDKDTGSFFLFDIDNLTAINEARGYAAGDQIIIEFADLLRATFREGDIVGRYGGDRFIAYMPEIGNKSVAKRKASSVMNRALYIKPDGVVPLSVSVAMIEDTSTVDDAGRLVMMATKTLEKIKKDGKSGLRFYDPSKDK